MILQGNTLTELDKLKDKSVHMIVTSPPYYRQRRYGVEFIWDDENSGCYELTNKTHLWEEGTYNDTRGIPTHHSQARNAGALQVRGTWKDKTCSSCGAWKGELGWERTADEFIRHLMQIFTKAHRVLRDDGLLFVNIKDSYKRKVRYCIPEKFVIAMQQAGWLPVQDIIWYKRNPMIESVRNRCTNSHEYIYIFSKKRNYFFDHISIQEDMVEYERARRLREKKSGLKTTFNLRADDKTGLSNQSPTGAARNVEARHALAELGKRNRRSVWEMNNTPSDVEHFATFTPELPMICIQAGTSQYGVCVHCGAPYKRILKPTAAYKEILGKGYHDHSQDEEKGMMQGRKRNTQNKMREAGMLAAEYETKGWSPTCFCYGPGEIGEVVPATVLDIFGGSGVTAVQASKLGRDFIMIEGNPESVKIIESELSKKLQLFNP